MNPDVKWKANLDKVAFMKQFPGLLGSWMETAGKTVKAVVPLKSKPEEVLVVFSDGSFLLVPPHTPEPWELTDGLPEARAVLEPHHREAYAEYDRLAAKDREATRMARMDKIIGAIENNLEEIPELKDRIKALVKEWK
jgi:hypothetical protein